MKVRALAVITSDRPGEVLWVPRCNIHHKGRIYWTLPLIEMPAPRGELLSARSVSEYLCRQLDDEWGISATADSLSIVDASRSGFLEYYIRCTMQHNSERIPEPSLPAARLFAHSDWADESRYHPRHQRAVSNITSLSADAPTQYVLDSDVLGKMTDYERPIKTAESIAINLNLGLDPLPYPELCEYCEYPQQREFLQYENILKSVEITVSGVPGYGCTQCSLKEWPLSSIARMMDAISAEAAERDNSVLALDCAHRAEYYRRSDS